MGLSVLQNVASTGQSGSASFSIAISATQAGSGIIVASPIENGLSVNKHTCGDNKGNTYVQRIVSLAAGGGSGAAQWAIIFDCLNPIVGVTSVTITAGSGGGNCFGKSGVLEVAGGPIFDQSGQAGTASNVSTQTVTASAADSTNSDLAVACICVFGANALGLSDPATGGATWTSMFVDQLGSTDNGAQGSYRLNSAGGTNSATWSWTAGAAPAGSVIASYKAPPGTSPILMGQACL